ncbi:RCC1-like domain-containing protein [Salinispora arenicola]|uniref:RCC1-like domain-containing protein n=1 Tax=Salinispora arenicola TaxID=168697 RepID=UPI0009B78BF7
MQGRWRRLGRDIGGRRAGRTLAGWFSLALAVTVPQAIGELPASAQPTSPTTAAASETLLAWGDNNQGQPGSGTTTGSNEPVAVSLPSGATVTAVTARRDHSLASTSTSTSTSTCPPSSAPPPCSSSPAPRSCTSPAATEQHTTRNSRAAVTGTDGVGR